MSRITTPNIASILFVVYHTFVRKSHESKIPLYKIKSQKKSQSNDWYYNKTHLRQREVCAHCLPLNLWITIDNVFNMSRSWRHNSVQSTSITINHHTSRKYLPVICRFFTRPSAPEVLRDPCNTITFSLTLMMMFFYNFITSIVHAKHMYIEHQLHLAIVKKA